MTVRVRFAPSPTGKMHIGNLRNAFFDYFYARATGGKFLLRIEDTDQGRSTEGSIQNIYDTLRWLGLSWDEGPDVGGPFGPYVQSERNAVYGDYAAKLVSAGHAYRCYCSPERLEAVRKEQTEKKLPVIGYDRHCRDLTETQRAEYDEQGLKPVIRLRIPLESVTVFRDEILGDIEKANIDINPDPVLLKSDGFPTYHLANVIDDHLMEITHVIRSQEWLSSGPIHLHLYQAFGWEPPKYYHPPLILGKDGHKLAKRHGSTTLDEFREKGYLPEAIVNYVTLLGWSYDDTREFFSREEFEKLFTLDKLSKSSAVFDYKKLDWFNGQYMRKLEPADLRDRLVPFMQQAGLFASPPTEAERKTLLDIVPLIRERLTLLSDCASWTSFFFEDVSIADPAELVPKKGTPEKTLETLTALNTSLAGFEGKSEEELESDFKALAEKLGVKLGDLLMPLRVALTGTTKSPPLMGSMLILGKDKVEARLSAAIALLGEKV
ncbi:MAG: glutamate--tRNA ligase [Spirochaetales bacterium]|nr:glutamate--tRNA ligase [Spirochaetales bacterium]